LRLETENHVRSYDFVKARTHNGPSLRLLTMIDEFTRKCLAIRVVRRLNRVLLNNQNNPTRNPQIPA
jgi:hypothetical protein